MVTMRSNGAFQNPCMAVANWATGYEPSWQRTLILIIAEFCGGLLAALFFQVVPSFNSSWVGPGGFTSDYLISSMIATSMHVLILLSVLNLNISHGDPMYLYLLLPILLGISGTLGNTFTSRAVTADACNPMNPAFSLAVALSKSQWQDHWVDWIGPSSGAVIASVLHLYIFQQRKLTPTTSL